MIAEVRFGAEIVSVGVPRTSVDSTQRVIWDAEVIWVLLIWKLVLQPL